MSSDPELKRCSALCPIVFKSGSIGAHRRTCLIYGQIQAGNIGKISYQTASLGTSRPSPEDFNDQFPPPKLDGGIGPIVTVTDSAGSAKLQIKSLIELLEYAEKRIRDLNQNTGNTGVADLGQGRGPRQNTRRLNAGKRTNGNPLVATRDTHRPKQASQIGEAVGNAESLAVANEKLRRKNSKLTDKVSELTLRLENAIKERELLTNRDALAAELLDGRRKLAERAAEMRKVKMTAESDLAACKEDFGGKLRKAEQELQRSGTTIQQLTIQRDELSGVQIEVVQLRESVSRGAIEADTSRKVVEDLQSKLRQAERKLLASQGQIQDRKSQYRAFMRGVLSLCGKAQSECGALLQGLDAPAEQEINSSEDESKVVRCEETRLLTLNRYFAEMSARLSTYRCPGVEDCSTQAESAIARDARTTASKRRRVGD